MTTTVIVKTHDWPAEVLGFPLEDRKPIEGGEYQSLGRVEPNSEATFHPHNGLDIVVRELPSPEEAGQAANARDDEALRQTD